MKAIFAGRLASVGLRDLEYKVYTSAAIKERTLIRPFFRTSSFFTDFRQTS